MLKVYYSGPSFISYSKYVVKPKDILQYAKVYAIYLPSVCTQLCNQKSKRYEIKTKNIINLNPEWTSGKTFHHSNGI